MRFPCCMHEVSLSLIEGCFAIGWRYSLEGCVRLPLVSCLSPISLLFSSHSTTQQLLHQYFFLTSSSCQPSGTLLPLLLHSTGKAPLLLLLLSPSILIITNIVLVVPCNPILFHKLSTSNPILLIHLPLSFLSASMTTLWLPNMLLLTSWRG
jgi:hypothetical protein